MTDLSQRMFDYLSEHPHVSMSDLERAVGARQRGLQSEGDEPGPFRVAVKEIYQETGWIVFSRSGAGGGVTMTKDVALAEEAMERLASHARHEADLAELLRTCIGDARERERQQKHQESQMALTL